MVRHRNTELVDIQECFCSLQVTDFGLSKFVDSNTMLKTFCGTPNYLAPEVLLTAGKGAYTKAIDCWSLGVILFIWCVADSGGTSQGCT